MAIRLLCKNKDTKWVYKKVNEFFKPLIYKIPLENVNFKATVIILIGNICNIRPQSEFDESSLNELRRWLTGLTEGEYFFIIVDCAMKEFLANTIYIHSELFRMAVSYVNEVKNFWRHTYRWQLKY